MRNRLLLVDGNAVLHRAYYALPDWRNRSGEATAGVYGFLSMLLKANDELEPTHLAVVFDCPEPTFRHTMYVGYQVTREKDRQVSEDIWGQVEKLKVVFEKMGVPVFAVPGFEADDVIGTLSLQAINPKPQVTSRSHPPHRLPPKLGGREEGGIGNNEVVIITGDRDLMQLVNKQEKLYMPQKGLSDGIIIDEQKVIEKLGVNPDQVVDYKALVGDSSDNYPGVTGVGPRGAIDLISNYTNFENIYENLENIKETVRKKLADGYEGGRLSRELAKIRTDVPVSLEWERAQIPSQEKILDVLKELGYKSLIKRIGGEDQVDDNQQKLFE